jgi:TolB-like protein
MKKAFFCFALINLALVAYSQELLVSVSNFIATTSGYSEEDLRTITELFAGFLLETGEVRVVTSASQNDAILKEQDFHREGLVAQSEIKELGKFLGAQAVITGELSKLGSRNILNLFISDVETRIRLSTAQRTFESVDDFYDLLPSLANDIVTRLKRLRK